MIFFNSFYSTSPMNGKNDMKWKLVIIFMVVCRLNKLQSVYTLRLVSVSGFPMHLYLCYCLHSLNGSGKPFRHSWEEVGNQDAFVKVKEHRSNKAVLKRSELIFIHID